MPYRYPRRATPGLMLLAIFLMVRPPAYASPISPNQFLGISTMRLWTGRAPGAIGRSDQDTPTLTEFSPQRHHGNGTAVIVAPGGAYISLAGNLEGRQVADWFAARGIAAFVLKYRIAPRYRWPIQLEDAQRAVRYVRSHAKTYGIAPNRIGMIGFSAGGHLTAMVATHFDAGEPNATNPIDRVSDRPDFIILGYPVISFEQLPRDSGWPNVFLGPHPSPHLIEELSTNLHVTAHTPPTFIYATTDDNLVPVEQSILFYSALHAAGVSVEMHLFAHGPHGTGLGSSNPSLDLWPQLLENWLRARGLLSVAPQAMMKVRVRGPLSIDSTMGELLSDPAARAVLSKELPEFVSSPQISMARDMSLRSLQPFAPKVLTPALLSTVNRMLRSATDHRN